MINANAEEAILALARNELDCWSNEDLEGYAQSADDDVTYYDNVGAQKRVEGIKAFRGYLASLKGQIPRHNYKIVDPKVQVYDNIGILTMHYHALTAEGDILALGKGTCVYRHHEGAWHMVHAHWSTLEEA